MSIRFTSTSPTTKGESHPPVVDSNPPVQLRLHACSDFFLSICDFRRCVCVQEKYYDLLGHNLYDLCSRMLAWDPDQRITAQGALQSQYCRVRTWRCHSPKHQVEGMHCRKAGFNIVGEEWIRGYVPY